MADGLAAKGYGRFRRSDPAAVRMLQRGPMSIGRLGAALGVTRQAARKVAGGLERRGFAILARDEIDTRQINVVLTPDGEAYADAVQSVIEKLNRAVTRNVRPADLAVADTVLRAVLADDRTQRLAELLAPPSR